MVCYGLGSHCGIPAVGDHVHKVHSDLPAPGAVLRPGSSPSETTGPAARSRWSDGPSSGTEE